VRDLQGVSQVAVVGADDKVSFKKVTLGPAYGSDYVVESGITAGERVVVEGLQKIREGMLVKPGTAQKSATSPASATAEPGN
jgi:membrane fusion protein (multidrug efflux system)